MARAKLNLGGSSTAHTAAASKPKAKQKAAEDSAGKGSREGTQLVGGHFSKGTAKKLKQIALERDTTVQALLGEAIDDLFAKYR